jgi:hypothetical protein
MYLWVFEKMNAIFKFLSNIRNKLKNIDVIHSGINRHGSISGNKLPLAAFERYAIQSAQDSHRDACESGVFVSENSIESVAYSLDKIYEDLHPTKKIAFLIHEPSMLVHYADVWKALGSSRFSIVTTKYFDRDVNGVEKLGVVDFFNFVNKEGYQVIKIDEIIECGIKFDYVVTNHVISGNTKTSKPESSGDYFKKILNRGLVLAGKDPVWKFSADIDTYLPLQVGNRQIRYMYGADISDGWSLQRWNEIYDVFLCHGVNDEREIRNRFKGKTFVMGYPRYDSSFCSEMDLSNIRSEFGIAKSKKTVLWMPTLGGDYSSIPLFSEPLSRLNEKYNIIVRPHPISFVQEPDFIAQLERLNFTIDRNAVRDMNELFAVADVVLVDNGGTPFSAIFLGKNVVFLAVPDDLGTGSAASAYIVGCSVMELKKHLPVVHHQDIGKLESMLDSDEFYKVNKKIIEGLFKKYFDSPRGGGAKRVVEIFNSL